jgi:CBS-domain-containing membrane protein
VSLPKVGGRLRGSSGSRPATHPGSTILWAATGGFVGILTLALVGASASLTLLLGSFGASCVLLFGYPEAAFAQPANAVCGHLISAAIGLAFFHWVGPAPWSLAGAVGCAIAAMMATRTVHPPAGSNPVIVFLGHPGWGFLVFPVLAGVLLLTLVALVFHTVIRRRTYPLYW